MNKKICTILAVASIMLTPVKIYAETTIIINNYGGTINISDNEKDTAVKAPVEDSNKAETVEADDKIEPIEIENTGNSADSINDEGYSDKVEEIIWEPAAVVMCITDILLVSALTGWVLYEKIIEDKLLYAEYTE